ncbi:hypothetical protein NDI37_08530 [Funiculus sociatus GB2-A5]|uniref:Uncharacterized protein n=1 Tax=Funiculus sociatus GB2-A5 TaxID=2933946 RepID=A0ABV0JML9_9CYAN|nr:MULTISPECIES: hypothetical protein [unclassified Trichocoleus]MBD1904879.1 hypothetical protein [Trichocoleus sp. FACHB-832]MBD2005182.1 hypothetical protein [Trichocoleus sp. FACHB-40]MBD2064638.1 hypothetical protein [Trichocoleus sp. FACHB-6]
MNQNPRAPKLYSERAKPYPEPSKALALHIQKMCNAKKKQFMGFEAG